ncbi:hypothetical protein PHMEG_00013642 [Phytophthora megakarya]|uniref:FHA domain-containing protein n=1 Tax=Phytophthora megakarya TaxID=4795 RepID=A0A225W7W8_9STRA|nr:hypothetical protein PHMEG_00013642 [Phytophthora megakarya]
MVACPPCFRLEATRGPHNGVFLVHCHVKACVASPSSSASSLSIGRKKRCSLRLPKDLEVSSVHAEFRFVANDTRVILRDVKSTNGTKLNGQLLKPHKDFPLSNGDLIGVGKTSLRFVQVQHGLPCGEEAGSVKDTSTVLTSSASSSITPGVIMVDEDSGGTAEGSNAARTSDPPTDQPDIEPGKEQLVGMKQPKNVVASIKEGTKDVGLSLAPKLTSAEKRGSRIEVLNQSTLDQATCSVCRVVIGQLDLLEQQAHLNECLGGRITAFSTATRMAVDKVAQPKTRKLGNATGGTTRTKRPKELNTGEYGGTVTATTIKTKKPRKRKRVDAGENIELTLALMNKTTMSKEEQTDTQLAVTKKKFEQLDEQIAKLAKRRANLVKTLDRLERTKEKLRKSHVLPPAKVLKLLDIEAALDAIFPSNLLAKPSDQYRHEKVAESYSAVARQYIPARWNENGMTTDCDKDEQAELAVVAAISMWARASQQLFGLQRNTLLYRNNVLRAYLDDDKDADSSVMNLDGVGDVDDKDVDTRVEHQQVESEQKTVLRSTRPDLNAKSSRTDVPNVVKCVFPNWQRDLSFLHDQTVGELEMAFTTMNETQTQTDGAAINNGESRRIDDCMTDVSEGHEGAASRVMASTNHLSTREQQRLACNYMAHIMRTVIDEKLVSISEVSMEEKESVIDLVDSSGNSQHLVQQSGLDTTPQ